MTEQSEWKPLSEATEEDGVILLRSRDVTIFANAYKIIDGELRVESFPNNGEFTTPEKIGYDNIFYRPIGKLPSPPKPKMVWGEWSKVSERGEYFSIRGDCHLWSSTFSDDKFKSLALKIAHENGHTIHDENGNQIPFETAK